MTPQEIETLLQQNGSGRPRDKYDDDDDVPDSEPPAGDCERRTALLLPVLSACREAWASKSEELDAMAQKLGDGSINGDFGSRLPARPILGEYHKLTCIFGSGVAAAYGRVRHPRLLLDGAGRRQSAPGTADPRAPPAGQLLCRHGAEQSPRRRPRPPLVRLPSSSRRASPSVHRPSAVQHHGGLR